MSSKKIAIRIQNASKCYSIYERPEHRLLQWVVPRLQACFGLSKTRYGRQFWALRDASFEIVKGETVGIIGRNGSGKSTLLQMICGTVSPTCGTIETHGRVAALLELGAGFNPEFTGRENVYLNAAILGLTQEETQARFDDIAAFADIGSFMDQPTKTYSSGMYVRLAFAVAINVDPEILIIDEALAVGDVRFQAKCMRRLKDIQDSGAAILFVSHDVSAVRTLCQRAIWLEAGRICMLGDVFPVTGRYMERMLTDEVASSAILNHAPIEDPAVSPMADLELDARPVTHWGSHVGTVLAAGIYDVHGQRVDVISWQQPIVIKVKFRLPETNKGRGSLSVAFSIKDRRGTDIVVSTTHDQHQVSMESIPDGIWEVAFSLNNPLVAGKYLLVAAVEDRSSSAIHYYEYIEGAHYFGVVSETMFFGICQPPIQQTLHMSK